MGGGDSRSVNNSGRTKGRDSKGELANQLHAAGFSGASLRRKRQCIDERTRRQGRNQLHAADFVTPPSPIPGPLPGSKTARRLGGNVDSPNQSPLARIQISGLLRLENTWKYIAPPVDAQLKNIC